jgi:ABC-type sugar transport system substrate-binding protein
VRSNSKIRGPRLAVAAALVAAVAAVAATAALASSHRSLPGSYGENYNASPALMKHAFGTAQNVPDIVKASVYRAGLPVDKARLDLAIKCWKENTCDTGTGGKLTVAEADGFGDNVWREITHMEFVLQALTYPEIGKIIYTNGHANTQKQISDLRGLIAQKVDVIVGFPDAGAALLPTIKQATQRGITYVPYLNPIGQPGKDYLTVVAEDLCQLGKNFAGILNTQVKTGKVVFLGGTPGNGLSKAWQGCEKPALGPGLQLVGTADTNWTRQGTLQAMSGFLSKHPDLKGVSYEYADGFLGGIRAYQAAHKPLDLVLTLRTDEEDLFCQWKQLHQPNFKVYFSTGGGYDSRIALTAAMMKRSGATIPSSVVVPAKMQQVTASTCNPKVPGQAPASALVPTNVLKAMYP